MLAELNVRAPAWMSQTQTDGYKNVAPAGESSCSQSRPINNPINTYSTIASSV